jgi:hypothetical protein
MFYNTKGLPSQVLNRTETEITFFLMPLHVHIDFVVPLVVVAEV